MKRGRGRPKGSRNKVNPSLEISRAFSSGKSLTDIVEFLSNKLDDKEVTAVQKGKFLEMLVKIKLDLLSKEIKLNDVGFARERGNTPSTDKKEIPNNIAVFQNRA